MEYLLAKGKMWFVVFDRAKQQNKELVLGAFFDFCKRMTQASTPIGPPMHTISAVLDELMLGHNSRRGESLGKEKSKTGVPSVDVRDRAQLGDFLKFVNREKSINTLLVHASGQYERYLKGFGPKEGQVAACSGGPGPGKTMFCRKALRRAGDEKGLNNEVIWKDVKQEFAGVDKSFKSIVRECVDNGRLFHISFEGRAVPEERLDVATSLAWELLICLLKFKRVGRDAFAGHESVVLLRGVIRRIADGDKNAFVRIHFDETNVVMRYEDGRRYLVNMLGKIREINESRTLGFLYCILSGTNARSLHDLLRTASCVAPLEVPLPLLECHHVREVLCDLAERGSNKESLGKDLDFFINVLDGVPRYIEMLVFVLGCHGNEKVFRHGRFTKCLKLDSQPAAAILEAVKIGITTQYGSKFELTLTGLPVFGLVATSLFQWHMNREDTLGGGGALLVILRLKGFFLFKKWNRMQRLSCR